MESTGNDTQPVPSQQVSNKYIGYRARQIRFWTFASVALIVAILAGILGFKYSEQESSINQIDTFAVSEQKSRSDLRNLLETDDAKAYLANIDTSSEEWNRIVEARDAKRVEARQNAINKFSGTGWFPDLNERLETVADKSFGDREGVNDAMKAHAVGIYSQGCVDAKVNPNSGVEGALKNYDATTAEFYKGVEQDEFQKSSVAFFRTVLEDSLKKGCPDVATTPAIADPLLPSK